MVVCSILDQDVLPFEAEALTDVRARVRYPMPGRSGNFYTAEKQEHFFQVQKGIVVKQRFRS